MAMLDAAMRKFLTLDTADQERTLRRVGVRTACADSLLDMLAATEPERFRVLALRMDDEYVSTGVQA